MESCWCYETEFEFGSLMAWGKKLLLSLPVSAIMLRERLPDGSKMKRRQAPGYHGNQDTSARSDKLYDLKVCRENLPLSQFSLKQTLTAIGNNLFHEFIDRFFFDFPITYPQIIVYIITVLVYCLFYCMLFYACLW